MSSQLPAPKGGMDFLASAQAALGISWFYNQFKAVATQRGTVTGVWTQVTELANVGDFEALLREAIRQTGFRGSSVFLVLAQSWSAQQMVDLPPVKGSALKKILARQAQQQKFFSGAAAWSYEESVVEGDSRRIILHLLPQAALNQLTAACQRNGLHLVSAVPPSTVFQQQLRQLPLEKSDVALLAGETGGGTTVVIGRNDGCLLLVRTLHGTWKEGGERLALDLNRTIQFANQKYGIALSKELWLYGPGAAAQASSVQSHMQNAIAASPVEYDPFYAATRALALRPQLTSNFISPVMQKAQQRDVFARAVLVMTALVVLVSLAVTIFALVQARQEKNSIRQLAAQCQRLEAQQTTLEALKKQLAREQSHDQIVLNDRPPAVPLWLFAALGETVPPGLTVTNFHVRHEENFWKVQLGGVCRTAADAGKTLTQTSPAALLAARLAGAPFHLKILGADAATKESSRTSAGGISTWLANLGSAPVAKAADDSAGHFEIEGVLR